MEIILLDKIRNLGNIGDKVAVRAGYARNFLIPYGKAAMATGANLEKFAKMRAQLEQAAAEALKSAQDRATQIADKLFKIPVKATEEGKLFGSITPGSISKVLQDAGFAVKKSEISMPQGPIRQIGEYDIHLLLHSDVTANIKVMIVPAE